MSSAALQEEAKSSAPDDESSPSEPADPHEVALQKIMQEIDQIERDLHELTHEREVLQLKITGAAGIASTGEPPRMGSGKPPDVLALLPEGHPSMDDDALLAPSQDVDDEPGTSTAERR